MKKVDFIGQTIIFILFLLLLYEYSSYKWFDYSDMPTDMAFGSLEFIIGIWQIVSALINFSNGEKTTTLKIYMIFVVVYISICIVIKQIDHSSINDFDMTEYYANKKFFLNVLSCAWYIAFYYYILTGIRTFRKQKS